MFIKSRQLNVRIAILALGLLLTLPCFAGGKVYNWVDANGVTHYDSSPPHDQETTVIKPKTGHSAPVVYKTPDSAIKAAEQKVVEEKRLSLKDPERCKAAKHNLKSLESFGRVKVKDDDGGFHYLTEEEQQEKIKFAKKVMREAC